MSYRRRRKRVLQVEACSYTRREHAPGGGVSWHSLPKSLWRRSSDKLLQCVDRDAHAEQCEAEARCNAQERRTQSTRLDNQLKGAGRASDEQTITEVNGKRRN